MNKEALLVGMMFGGGGGNGLPAIESGDAGKVLKVNSGETGVEWGAAGGGGGGTQLYGPYYACAGSSDTISADGFKKFDLSVLYQEFGNYNQVTLPSDVDNEYWGILSSVLVQSSDQKALKIREISLKFNGNTYPSVTVYNDTNGTVTTGNQNILVRFYSTIELPSTN